MENGDVVRLHRKLVKTDRWKKDLETGCFKLKGRVTCADEW